MKPRYFPALAMVSFLAVGHIAPASAGSTHNQPEKRLQSLDQAQAKPMAGDPTMNICNKTER
jgi:hypothetical protein